MLADAEPDVHVVGHLALHRYCNMDQVVALTLSNEVAARRHV